MKSLRISFLTPTRGRPEGLARMVKSAMSTANRPQYLEILAYVDPDDPRRDDYRAMLWPSTLRLVIGERPRSANQASSELLRRARGGDVFFSGTDDIVFRTKGWDERVAEAFAAVPDGLLVAYTNNGRDRRKCEHWFAGRAWVEALGYLSHPGFEHFCSDQWIEELARELGRLVYLREVVTEHMHFKYGKGIKDDTYARKRGVDAQGKSMSDRDNARLASMRPEFNAELAKLRALMSLPVAA